LHSSTYSSRSLRHLHSFPTRRSSDLTNIIYGLSLGYESAFIPVLALSVTVCVSFQLAGMYGIAMAAIGMISTIPMAAMAMPYMPDRKSTRLNSSHVEISYAVFCLKKK